MKPTNIYDKRGVSAQKEDVHAATKGLSQGLFPGAFCQGHPHPLDPDGPKVVLHHADGAGTKSALAWMYWKETGDLSVWKGIAQDAVVMNTDDLICVGATDGFLLSSTIGRNRNKVPGEVLTAIIQGTQEMVEMLNENGCRTTFTGGETADVGDLVRTIIVDATVSTEIDREHFIDASQMKPGLAIVGFASFGQAVYETAYNAGMGSNGLTAARHEIFRHEYLGKYPETVDPALDPGVVYQGSHGLTEPLPGTPLDWGKAVLSPTRTYLPVVRALLSECREGIGALIHNSGGGQTKCLKFGRGLHFIKDNLFPLPPLFAELAQRTPGQEFYQVFNGGHRLEVYCDPAVAETLIAIGEEFGVEGRLIGRTEAAPENKLSLTSPLGKYEWGAPAK